MTDSNDDDHGTGTKLLLTAVVAVLMVPGLIIEPGPVSEATGAAIILGLWGLGGSNDD